MIEAQAAGLKCLVSDAVSEEARITDLVTFLPLVEEEWYQAIVQSRIDNDRERWDKLIAEKGYDVKEAARHLKDLYNI